MEDEIENFICERLRIPLKYVAIDKSGGVFAFSKRPKIEGSMWIVNNDEHIEACLCYIKDTKNWQESLREIKDGKLIKVEGEE